ncbi:MAG: hypothetical protein AAF577_13640, partial [Pseudomonadota bacterium]
GDAKARGPSQHARGGRPTLAAGTTSFSARIRMTSETSLGLISDTVACCIKNMHRDYLWKVRVFSLIQK